MAAAVADEVSASIASLFNSYAQGWQAVIGRAAVFHSEFAQTLAAGGNAYASAEAASRHRNCGIPFTHADP